MAEERREEPRGRFERQRASLCQSARYEFETSPARRRLPARLFLCEDEWNEKEVDEREDGKRSELTHQQST
jgi:hypothetical protein